jgi:Flp pilus assembly protein TadD
MLKKLTRKIGGPDKTFNWQEKNSELVSLINNGDLKRAIPLARELVEFADRKYSRDSVEKATSYNNMGMVCLLARDYSLAETCFRDALSMRQRLFGNNHNEVAVVMLNLVELYKVQAQEIFAENRVNG